MKKKRQTNCPSYEQSYRIQQTHIKQTNTLYDSYKGTERQRQADREKEIDIETDRQIVSETFCQRANRGTDERE